MSLRTSSWLLPQNEQTRFPARSSCLAINASRDSLGRTSANDYLIDDSVFNRLFRREEEIPVEVLFDLAGTLSAVQRVDLNHFFTRAQNFARVDLDVAGLALHAAERLMNVDPRVRQRIAPSLGARSQQQRRHAVRLSHAEGRYR